MEETTPKNKIYLLTPSLKRYWYILDSLGSALNLAAQPVGFFRKRIDSSAIIEVSKAYSVARGEFWTEVYRTWPELKGKDLTANVHEITIL